MGLLLNAIPLPYRIIGSIAIATFLIGGAGLYGYHKGVMKSEIVIAQYNALREKLSSEISEVQVTVVDRIVTQYVDRIIKVKEVGAHNEQVAKDVVPDKSILSNGWVYTHDASARGEDADSTISADATPSGVEANQALGTVIDNYATCKEVREQVIGWQNWYTESAENIRKHNEEMKKHHK
jgi:hypothetical protein